MTITAGGPTPSHLNPQAPQGPALYLASRSPRRRLMLTEAGIPHDTLDAGVDDGILLQGRVTPDAWVLALAYLKARAGLARLAASDPTPVLGADTVIDKAGRVIGQPRDHQHAREIIHALRDGSHRVITGVAVVTHDPTVPTATRRALLLDAATVTLGHITDHDIDRYVQSESWRGKAGGYNFSERHAAGWPITCDGDPTTVMGLPMTRLPRWLQTALAP
ncbi:MAG: Maf family protein [Planctomycetes bacterium]|nr:Maf family protein [Planctomycetota bacterium]